MLVILASQLVFVYGYNQSALNNTTSPDSILNTKYQSIAYHFSREDTARDECLTSYINSLNNSSDSLMKTIHSGEWRDNLL